jgi:hypothetical protein
MGRGGDLAVVVRCAYGILDLQTRLDSCFLDLRVGIADLIRVIPWSCLRRLFLMPGFLARLAQRVSGA